jgi:hypothetical protein
VRHVSIAQFKVDVYAIELACIRTLVVSKGWPIMVMALPAAAPATHGRQPAPSPRPVGLGGSSHRRLIGLQVEGHARQQRLEHAGGQCCEDSAVFTPRSTWTAEI